MNAGLDSKLSRCFNVIVFIALIYLLNKRKCYLLNKQ